MKITINTADLEKYVEETSEPNCLVDGQLSSFDRLIYYWAARDFYSGIGTIIDGGALVGATTKLLAEGLKANIGASNHSQPIIHVYDLFQDEANGYSAQVIKKWYGEQANHDEIYDWEHIFKRNLANNHAQIEVHKGDISKQPYVDKRPIEVLSIDVAKTPDLMVAVAKNFFPHMLEERSIVLHQDYVFAFQPWLHVAMEKLTDHFEKVYDPPTNCTSVFQLIKPISENEITKLLGSSGSDYYNLDNVKYLYQAIEKADTHFGKIILTANLSYFYMMMGKKSTAEFVAKRMLDEFDVNQAFLERTDLQNLFSSQLGLDYSQFYKLKTTSQVNTARIRTHLREMRNKLRNIIR